MNNDNDENDNKMQNNKNISSIRDGEFNGKIYRDYKIIEPIGQGKFSFVFRAKRIQDNVLVALKLIKVSIPPKASYY
jgi:serine/threonine protein kinase